MTTTNNTILNISPVPHPIFAVYSSVQDHPISRRNPLPCKHLQHDRACLTGHPATILARIGYARSVPIDLKKRTALSKNKNAVSKFVIQIIKPLNQRSKNPLWFQGFFRFWIFNIGEKRNGK